MGKGFGMNAVAHLPAPHAIVIIIYIKKDDFAGAYHEKIILYVIKKITLRVSFQAEKKLASSYCRVLFICRLLLKGGAMNMQVIVQGSYRIVRMLDDVAVTSDISDLRASITDLLKQGARNIAIEFTSESYLSSRSASVLIACFEMIREHKGELAVINPNPTICHLLTIIDLERVIRVVESESALSDVHNVSSASA
jgi:anti-anti-sigma factor